MRVGWSIRTEALKLRVPPYSPIGTQLRCAGMGDDSEGRVLSPFIVVKSGDLMVEIADEGVRATELARLQKAHEDELTATWNELRYERQRDRSNERKKA